jgi:hypothetical protein
LRIRKRTPVGKHLGAFHPSIDVENTLHKVFLVLMKRNGVKGDILRLKPVNGLQGICFEIMNVKLNGTIDEDCEPEKFLVCVWVRVCGKENVRAVLEMGLIGGTFLIHILIAEGAEQCRPARGEERYTNNEE